MSAAPTDVPTARQMLLHAGDPGDRHLTDFVRTHGPVEAVARLMAGQDPSKDGRHAARVRGADLEREHARAAEVGARLVCPEDPEWPTAHLQGLDAERGPADIPGGAVPHALWVRGPEALDDLVARSVAVVGSRASTAYGEHVATDLASGLSDLGWTVVSGGAYGIDGAAHRACLAVGGRTVAVLAGGVDDAYPRGHAALLERITREGLVVSELPLGEHPTRSRFLERNRLIAALSLGTVVVEMARRSGAANTLSHAEWLCRPVMAVPGPVTSAMSAGCHDRILDRRAELVCDAADVVRLVGPIGVLPERQRRTPPTSIDALGNDALAVYEALPASGPVPSSQVALLAQLPGPVVGDALRDLVTAGLVHVGPDTVERTRATRRPGP